MCRYAPTAPDTSLRALAMSFEALNTLHVRGRLSYPYSTREAVAVARHFNGFPTDGMVCDMTVYCSAYCCAVRADKLVKLVVL
jgi:hypothetical protein